LGIVVRAISSLSLRGSEGALEREDRPMLTLY
jgi:hypothetical protein